MQVLHRPCQRFLPCTQHNQKGQYGLHEHTSLPSLAS